VLGTFKAKALRVFAEEATSLDAPARGGLPLWRVGMKKRA
jgi:hypothetical protein